MNSLFGDMLRRDTLLVKTYWNKAFQSKEIHFGSHINCTCVEPNTIANDKFSACKNCSKLQYYHLLYIVLEICKRYFAELRWHLKQ